MPEEHLKQVKLLVWIVATFSLLFLYVASADPVKVAYRKTVLERKLFYGFKTNPKMRFESQLYHLYDMRPAAVQRFYATLDLLEHWPSVHDLRVRYQSWWEGHITHHFEERVINTQK